MDLSAEEHEDGNEHADNQRFTDLLCHFPVFAFLIAASFSFSFW